MGYIRQLDSVRAIAVLFVVLWHWAGKSILSPGFHLGHLGVEIFFVLSGFLITQILLQNRNKAEQAGPDKKHLLRSFYARRILRIFPIYYLTILLTFLLHRPFQIDLTKSELAASLSYTSNFFIYTTRYWPGGTSHFWSLAVEEQFYLFWPLFMLFIPKKFLGHCIILFILLGFFSQYLFPDPDFGKTLLTSCFSYLGMGALLGWFITYRARYLLVFYKTVSLVTLLFFLYHFLPVKMPLPGNLVSGCFHALIALWVITHILVSGNQKTWLTFILNNKLLMQIGKVSYGIYLYHILFGYVAGDLWYRFLMKWIPDLSAGQFTWSFLLVGFPALFCLCWLSFRFIEKPFLSLKRKFSYQPKQQETSRTLARQTDYGSEGH